MSDLLPCTHHYPRQHHHNDKGHTVVCLTGLDKPNNHQCTACEVGAPLYLAQAVYADQWWAALPTETRVELYSANAATTPEPLPIDSSTTSSSTTTTGPSNA